MDIKYPANFDIIRMKRGFSMELKTKVGVSNRHIHLKERDFKILFGDVQLTKLRDINQLGQFAANEVVGIKTNKNLIENVRIIGPLRNYTQVEISKTDAYFLGLNPPIRKSGDIKGSESITLIGPKGQVTIQEGCIIANRHIHFTKEMAEKYNLVEDQRILVQIHTEKSGAIEAFVKISDDAYFELHLDTDDANAFLLKNNDEVDLMI